MLAPNVAIMEAIAIMNRIAIFGTFIRRGIDETTAIPTFLDLGHSLGSSTTYACSMSLKPG